MKLFPFGLATASAWLIQGPSGVELKLMSALLMVRSLAKLNLFLLKRN
ncbi:hypothetical protein LP420_31050 [Massilia sp. B-10]|nr:hypothetical protein LP420_31050 [Massilia sp. B-10]UUZ53218.1 hypothetical protein LP419_30615 [Massilia sp. H-1]